MNAIAAHGLTSLQEILAYRHAGAIRRYCKEQHASASEAEEIFQEMLKFLFLSYRAAFDSPQGFGCVVTNEIEKLDWMWHTFLLYTRDYAEFCERFFGYFLDHMPADDDEDEGAAKAVSAQDECEFRTTVEKQFSLVYDVLGEKTLRAWYDECRYAAKA